MQFGYALCLMGFVLGLFMFLGWASTPSMVVAEQSKTRAAEATVRVLATEVVRLQAKVPTDRPCLRAQPYFYGSC